MRAVLVFCEGQHDVVFTSRSLIRRGGVREVRPIGQLPSPFGPKLGAYGTPEKPAVTSVISDRYSNRALHSLQMRHAAHSAPPTFEGAVTMTSDDTYYVLIRCHGDSAANESQKLASDVRDKITFGADISAIGLAFLFDADSQGTAVRTAHFGKSHACCLPAGQVPDHATWKQGPFGPVGLFIFHDPATLRGTLEDTLAGLASAEWPAKWADAESYLSKHAVPTDPVSKKPAERHKARISISGQFLCPGDPMTEVIGWKSLPDKHFDGPMSKSLVDFLTSPTW